MNIVIAQDESRFIQQAAKLILESAVETLKNQEKFSISLSGGSTPKKIFSLLSDSYFRSRMPWSQMYFFFGDERCVPPDHQDSNYGMAHAAFLSKIPISSDRVFRMPGEMDPPRDAAKSYESQLKAFFKVDKSPPQFDLILLGMGEDGHTASLFPRSEALKEKDHWVAANYVEKFSAHRLTLTYPVLNNAKKVLFLCAGQPKAKVLKNILSETLDQTRYPVQDVKPTGDLVWLLDSKAASLLPNTVHQKSTHV